MHNLPFVSESGCEIVIFLSVFISCCCELLHVIAAVAYSVINLELDVTSNLQQCTLHITPNIKPPETKLVNRGDRPRPTHQNGHDSNFIFKLKWKKWFKLRFSVRISNFAPLNCSEFFYSEVVNHSETPKYLYSCCCLTINIIVLLLSSVCTWNNMVMISSHSLIFHAIHL